jgi:SEC-C motif
MWKLGRNDPCWCNSGKKYKKCHLDRDKMPAMPRQEALTGFRGSFNKKYCLHPEASTATCRGGIVKAHTIQRNGGLSKIAEKGHILQFELDFSTPPSEDPTFFTPKLIGLNKASTFTGFCNLHDTKTFEPIEKHPFRPTQEHTFLLNLGYRALCRELFTKKAAFENIPLMKELDRGWTMPEQIGYQLFVKRYADAVKVGLRDIDHHKAIYDKVLLSGDFSDSNFYVIFFDRTPDIMCSAGKFPTHDYHGNVLQDLQQADEIMDSISFSLIATDNGGAAVFSWIGSSSPCEKFIISLDSLTDDNIASAIVRYSFEFFENVFFSPSWWSSLEEKVKIKLQSRRALAIEPLAPREAECLVDDGLRLVSWKMLSRSMHLG